MRIMICYEKLTQNFTNSSDETSARVNGKNEWDISEPKCMYYSTKSWTESN